MLTPVARISGTKEKRPELDRLMQDAHRRRFDVVAVWKFDRMARSVSHLLRVLETFDALGIHFVSLSEAINTATPAGKLVFTVLGAVAELERSLIVERVRLAYGMPGHRARGLDALASLWTLSGFLFSGPLSSWSEIAQQTGWTKGTVQRAFYAQNASPRLPKNV